MLRTDDEADGAANIAGALDGRAASIAAELYGPAENVAEEVVGRSGELNRLTERAAAELAVDGWAEGAAAELAGRIEELDDGRAG